MQKAVNVLLAAISDKNLPLYKLKGKHSFDLFRKSKKVKGKYLSLSYIYFPGPADYLEKTKIAFVVSKKVQKLAVVRNKVKRRLREIYRKMYPYLYKGFNFITVALPGIEKATYLEIQNEMLSLFEKVFHREFCDIFD